MAKRGPLVTLTIKKVQTVGGEKLLDTVDPNDHDKPYFVKFLTGTFVVGGEFDAYSGEVLTLDNDPAHSTTFPSSTGNDYHFMTSDYHYTSSRSSSDFKRKKTRRREGFTFRHVLKCTALPQRMDAIQIEVIHRKKGKKVTEGLTGIKSCVVLRTKTGMNRLTAIH
ncbi:MAG TPA: hypothetical protein PLN21_18455 [Gemmatales bacterium]|nr:hypothetical protein [Gemmatales bacterium]